MYWCMQHVLSASCTSCTIRRYCKTHRWTRPAWRLWTPKRFLLGKRIRCQVFALCTPQHLCQFASASPGCSPPCSTMTDNCLCIAVSTTADVKARQVFYNVPFEDMHAPAVGPAHPFNKDGLAAGMRNHRAGHVEVSHFCLPL